MLGILSIRWWQVAFLIIVMGVSFWWGRGLAFAEQWPLYDGLRQTSAIVFGISGAWIAIIYPSAMTELVKKPTGKKPTGRDDVKKLLLPIEISTAVILAILFVGIAAPIVRHGQWPLVVKYLEFVRGASYAVAVGLTTIESWAVLCLLFPLEKVLRDVDTASAQQEATRRAMNLPGENEADEDD